MPILRVNLSNSGIRMVGEADDSGVLKRALAEIPANAPVTLLIHGYKLTPRSNTRCPHRHILSLEPATRTKRVISWPRHLGFGKGQPNEGLCIAIGWDARGSIWGAYGEAGRMGGALASLIKTIHATHRGPIGILAHSLGARVALSSMQYLQDGELRRMVLISGAEFREEALRAMNTPAGQQTDFINITSRENDLFDFMLEIFVRPFDVRAKAIGHGLKSARDNWLDVQIDCNDTRAGLARLGFRLPAPTRSICHWSGYLRPGMFTLHRALLITPDATPVDVLRKALPSSQKRRWSRLFAQFRPRPLLLFRVKVPF